MKALGYVSLGGIAGYALGSARIGEGTVVFSEGAKVSGSMEIVAPADDDPEQVVAAICGDRYPNMNLEFNRNILASYNYRFECRR